MPIKSACGKGKADTGKEAAYQAIESCKNQLGQQKPVLLLVFCSSLYDQQEVIRTISESFEGIPLVGCSTSGEIYQTGNDERSVSLTVLSGLDVQVEVTNGLARDSYEAGLEIGRRYEGKSINALITIIEGLKGDGAAVIEGLQAGMGTKIPIIGGAAGDDAKFLKTYVYYNNEILDDHVVTIGLAGDIQLAIGVKHGWEPIGLPITVTKVNANKLMEINGKPAIELYYDYLKNFSDRIQKEPLGRIAMYYPLGFAVSDSDEYMLRTPRDVDEHGAISFTANIPEDSKARIMLGSAERAIEAAKVAAEQVMKQLGDTKPQMLILFDCIARRRLFHLGAREEINVIKKIIGEDVPIVGFYTYGEIAPFMGQCNNMSCFHNETVVILALG